MNSADHLPLLLHWDSASAVSSSEPNRAIYPYNGRVVFCPEADGDEAVTIGKCSAEYIDVERVINSGESLFDCMDAHSSDILDYYEPIFGGAATDGMFNETILELTSATPFQLNLLVLHRLELLPQFRGQGIGLTVLRHMVLRLGAGAALVALKAYPLQLEKHADTASPDAKAWHEAMQLGQLPRAAAQSKAKLRAYYAQAGFKSVVGTDFMVLARDQMFTPGSNEDDANA